MQANGRIGKINPVVMLFYFFSLIPANTITIPAMLIISAGMPTVPGSAPIGINSSSMTSSFESSDCTCISVIWALSCPGLESGNTAGAIGTFIAYDCNIGTVIIVII